MVKLMEKVKSKEKCEITFPDRYVVFDLETTGFSPEFAEIIEIGAVRMEGGKPTDRFQSYVKPLRGIPARITELTGITVRHTMNAPYVDEVLSDFLSFIDDDILVAHNASFDCRFVCTVCAFLGYSFNNTVIDSLKLARKYIKAENYKLKTLKKMLGIRLASHNALDDCIVAGRVVEYCRKLSLAE